MLMDDWVIKSILAGCQLYQIEIIIIVHMMSAPLFTILMNYMLSNRIPFGFRTPPTNKSIT